MTLKSLLLIFTIVLFSSCAETEIPAYTDSSLYVFGDSLSDIGNANIATSGLLPGKNYYHGRFSNGLNYADRLAARIGTPMKPSRSYGSNYAFAGDRSIAVNAQVSNYKHNVDDKADPNALFILWAGGNDLLEILQGPTIDVIVDDVRIGEAIGHIENALRKLSNIGAQHIVVLNQVNMARLPRVIELETLIPGLLVKAEQLSIQFNNELNTMLDNLVNNENILTIRFSTYDLFEEISVSPETYNITNIDEPCYVKVESGIAPTGNETICSNSETYLFWDALHPTTAAHAILADRIYSIVTSE